MAGISGILARDMGEWEIGFEESIYRTEIKVLIWKHLGNGKDLLLRPGGEFETVESNAEIPGPSFTLLPGMVQGLMDALWKRGVRPKDVRYERELDLMKNHLEDMRDLVFLGTPIKKAPALERKKNEKSQGK